MATTPCKVCGCEDYDSSYRPTCQLGTCYMEVDKATSAERERCVKMVTEKMKEIAVNLEKAMPGVDSPSIVDQLVAAIRETAHPSDQR